MQLALLKLFALRRIHISDSINRVNRLNATLSLLSLKYTQLGIIEEYIITVFLRNFKSTITAFLAGNWRWQIRVL